MENQDSQEFLGKMAGLDKKERKENKVCMLFMLSKKFSVFTLKFVKTHYIVGGMVIVFQLTAPGLPVQS